MFPKPVFGENSSGIGNKESAHCAGKPRSAVEKADHVLKNRVVFVNDINDQITESKSLQKKTQNKTIPGSSLKAAEPSLRHETCQGMHGIAS